MTLSAEDMELVVAGALAEGALDEMIAEAADDDSLTVADTCVFARAGLMTANCGVVVELSDGSQFQLQIVRSR